MKFAFTHAMVTEKAPFHIARMCRLLDVTRQGYYAYVRSLRSPRISEDATLRVRIAELHAASLGSYGSPRIHRELRRCGESVSKRSVERIMRGAGSNPDEASTIARRSTLKAACTPFPGRAS